ncbi:MAG: chromosome partitioning protein [Nitrospira sp. WS110]|nr:chromosome partitioning protein [Nitrospira sp. WS110]
MVTREAIIEALRQVQEPELGQDLITLNMVREIEVEDDVVRFTVVLTTPACPLKADIKARCEEAVGRLPGVKTVDVRLMPEVPRSRSSVEGESFPWVKNVVAVGSGKGGVGKSTVAVNLTVALAREGASVGLLDADVYGPDIPMMMGIKEAPPIMRGRMVPAERYGVKVLSLGFYVPRDEPVIWRGPLIHKTMNQFFRETEWGDLDYLIVDLPPGTGDAPLSLVQLVPMSSAVVVTTPQHAAVRVAMKALQMYQKMNVSVLGIVENMSYFVCPRCGSRAEIFSYGLGEEEAQKLSIPFLGRIPLDPEIRAGGDKGQPLVVADPGSAAAEAFRQMAWKVAARIGVVNHARTRNHV